MPPTPAPPPTKIIKATPHRRPPAAVTRTLDGRALLTPAQVAALLSMSPDALRMMRHRDQGPPYVRLTPKVVRYRLPDVEDWISARTTAAGPHDHDR